MSVKKEPAWNEKYADVLRQSYTPPIIPPCRICGGALQIEAVGGGKPTEYACEQAQTEAGMDREHYENSRYEDRKQGGDVRVIAALNHITALEQKYQALVGVVESAQLQIEYLHSKFQETGSGNVVLAKIAEALRDVED